MLYTYLCRAFFSMGEHTLAVPMTLHKVNRRRLCERLGTRSDVPEGAVIVLQGGDSFPRYCSDVDVAPFRQVFKWNSTYINYNCIQLTDIFILQSDLGSIRLYQFQLPSTHQLRTPVSVLLQKYQFQLKNTNSNYQFYIEIRECEQRNPMHTQFQNNNIHFRAALLTFCILWYIMTNKNDIGNIIFC